MMIVVFVEVIIDDEVLGVGGKSSSLRRTPAGKEFQLKGNSQNTPFRPGGFEALSGTPNSTTDDLTTAKRWVCC